MRTGHSIPPLALTMGEPGGIGLEIAALAWRKLQARATPFFLVGNADLLAERLRRAGIEAPCRVINSPGEAAQTFRDALPVLPLPEAAGMADEPGKASRENAPAVIAAIRKGVELTLSGQACGLVTLPLQKESLYAAGFDFEGHTDFLASLARNAGLAAEPVMMLTAKDLRTIPITVHIAIKEVPRRLTQEAIVRQGRIVARDLTRFFGISAPRIAVAGLNPHAGEGGRMGTEEAEIIAPAIATLRGMDMNAFGPLPADTMFHPAARASYDAAICAYHDQALIPIKTLDFARGVNVTLGLPFVRSSPDHGTAYDIAGTDQADPASLVAALRMARAMAQARR